MHLARGRNPRVKQGIWGWDFLYMIYVFIYIYMDLDMDQAGPHEYTLTMHPFVGPLVTVIYIYI